MSATKKTPIWDKDRLDNPHGQSDKAARVRAMFDGIAPTYELVNRVLSAGRDASWRRSAVRLAQTTPDDRILDLACGTGDLARAFAAARASYVVGCDFSGAMLAHASKKEPTTIRWCQADALSLPIRDASFTVVSCAFGVRNFQNLAQGLLEAHRVLQPGGRIVILEFSLPKGRFLASAYLLYFRRILPRLASLISRDRSGAYRYLPASVSAFLDEAGMREVLESAGFTRIQSTRLSAGIVTVFVAWKN